MVKLLEILKNLIGLGSGHARSKLAKKNIFASFFIKAGNIAIGLMLVPLTINYLEPTKYGIWITLSSIIGWFGFFNIGLGHGLRYKFAKAIASGEHELARVYVSTTYAFISAILFAVLIIFYIVNPFLNWNAILNVGDDVVLHSELGVVALVLFTFFCLTLIVKLIATILTADQRPALGGVFNFASNVFALIVIYFLTKTTQGSLLYLGSVLFGMPVLVYFICSFWFFSGRYRIYRPSFKYVVFSEGRGLLSLGIKFFVIQISAILIFQTNNIIISQLFGPEEVTPYAIAYKYFNVLMMGFSIIVAPFWSAYTEAWVKKDITWIKNTVHKLIILWILLFSAGILMLVFSKWIFNIWIGGLVNVPFIMSALVGFFILLNAWNMIFNNFLNGVAKIKIQIYLVATAAVINVPLGIFLGKMIGIEGVLLANIITVIPQALIYPLQYKKIINFSAKGIWLR